MVITCGFGEERDGWRIEKSEELSRRRHPARKQERLSLKLLRDLSRIAHLDDFTRTRVRIALRKLFGGDSPWPPPLLPA